MLQSLQFNTRFKIENYFIKLNFALLIFSLFVMILGPLVRAEDAGLACPDWPLCNGKLIPEMTYQVFLEWLHRITAALLTCLFIAWAIIGLFHKTLRKSHFKLVIISLSLLVLQIALGALTITEKLDPYIINSHLLNAILFLSTLFFSFHKAYYLYVTSANRANRTNKTNLNSSKILILLSGLLLVLIFLQIFLGARVSSNYAGTACNTFPACYYNATINKNRDLTFTPEYFPPMIGNIEKHMSHRYLAYGLFIYLISFLYFAIRKKYSNTILRFLYLFLILFAIQIIIGAISVIFKVPVHLTVLHSFFAYIIYISAFWFFLEARLVSS